jgi:hypothetical protein
MLSRVPCKKFAMRSCLNLFASEFDLQSLMIDLKACFSNIRSGRLKLFVQQLESYCCFNTFPGYLRLSSHFGDSEFGSRRTGISSWCFLPLSVWLFVSVAHDMDMSFGVLTVQSSYVCTQKVGDEICRVSPSPFGRSHRDVWNTRMYARSMSITLTAFHKDGLLC